MNEIFAYRLKSARTMKGMSVKMLTEKLGVSKQMIAKYESGKSLPNSERLIALANILGVKPGYFFRPIGISLDDVKFRKKVKTSKTKVESIKARILNKMENYFIIEDILSIKPEFTNHLKNKVIKQINETDDLADLLRKKWNIGNDPISNVIYLLENHEIKVIEIDEDVNTSFDGMSTFVNSRFPAIVINKNFGIERKRFTLFHELGHLLLNIDKNFSAKEHEKICDAFAGAMLLPKSAIFNEIGEKRNRISLNELITLQEQYGISIPAIIYRLVSLKVIPQHKIKQFYNKLNTQPGLKERVYKERFSGCEKSERYEMLVYKALSQQLISVGKASELLDMDIATIQKKLTII